MAIFNLIRWIIDSFLSTDFLSVRNNFFVDEDEIWQLIVHMFFPPIVYFRGISGLLLKSQYD